jgi:hypothetical protein
MPACQRCNADYGRLERDLLVRLRLCVPPEPAATAGIVEKVLRSLDPKSASNEKDRKARAADRARILRELVPLKGAPEQGVFPGLGVRAEHVQAEYAGVLIPSASLERLGEKLVRGVTYLHYQKMLGPEYHIRDYVVDDNNVKELRAVLQERGRLFDRGPGVSIYRCEWDADPLTAIYRIVIWGQISFTQLCLTVVWGFRSLSSTTPRCECQSGVFPQDAFKDAESTRVRISRNDDAAR